MVQKGKFSASTCRRKGSRRGYERAAAPRGHDIDLHATHEIESGGLADVGEADDPHLDVVAYHVARGGQCAFGHRNAAQRVEAAKMIA